MTRPFPTLAYFCVWNRSLAVPDQRDEHDEDDAGVLYFGTKLDMSPFKRARKVGLAQGLVDFTSMLSSSAERVKAVHSSKQRMLFFEAEDGFYFHACIDLARLPRTDKGHIRQGSAASDTSGRPASPTVASDEGLEDETLLAGLRALYQDFKLLHGPLAALHIEHGRAGLGERLCAYFDIAIWRWQLERSVLGVGDFSDTLGALRASHAAPICASLPALAEMTTSCLLLHYTEVLHATASPPLAPLARHLLRSQPRRPAANRDKDAKLVKPRAASSTASKWTLGLSDYLVPSSAPPNTVAPTAPAPMLAPAATSNGRSWLRAVSWGSVTPKPKPAASPEFADTTGKGKPEVPAAEIDGDDAVSVASSESEIAEHIARIAFPPDSPTAVAAAVEPKSAEEPSEDAGVPEVQVAGEGEPPPEAEVDVDSPSEPPLRVFLGEAWYDAHIVKRPPLALAVVCDKPPPATQALALLDAVTAALTAQAPTDSTSTFRHLHHAPARDLALSHDWPSTDEAWSGGHRSAKEADALGALVDFVADPTLDEAFVRTGSGQWAAAARREARASYLVLPRRFGREAAEGSLLDAGHELAKVVQEGDRLAL